MILNCPQCASRFLVADALIPKDGRTVRCGACAHQWFVEGPADTPPLEPILPNAPVDEAAEPATPRHEPALESVPDDQPPAPAVSNVPALAVKDIPLRPFLIAAPLIFLLWLISAMVSYYPALSEAPLFSGLYHLFGFTDSQGVAFADVKMQREETDSKKTRFILSGNIVNRSGVNRTVPAVRVLLNDKSGDKVWSRDYPVNIELKPGEMYPFRIVNVETSFGDKVATIILDIGNSLELMVR